MPYIKLSTIIILSLVSLNLWARSIKGTTPSVRPRSTIGINYPTTQSTPNTDVLLRYRYSDAKGTGAELALESGTDLHTGDRFTIEITANSQIYLYLFHFDSHANVNELLNLAGHSNQLTPGNTLFLPGAGKHFYLDNAEGEETIYTIVSPTPRDDLKQLHEQKLLNASAIRQRFKKNINIGDNAPSPQPVAEVQGQELTCTEVEGCVAQFIIHPTFRTPKTMIN